MTLIQVDSEMRPYADGERHRPIQHPKDWMNAEHARKRFMVFYHTFA